MVESGLFTFFSRPAQAYVWTKTKAFYQSCTLKFLRLTQPSLTRICSRPDLAILIGAQRKAAL